MLGTFLHHELDAGHYPGCDTRMLGPNHPCDCNGAGHTTELDELHAIDQELASAAAEVDPYREGELHTRLRNLCRPYADHAPEGVTLR